MKKLILLCLLIPIASGCRAYSYRRTDDAGESVTMRVSTLFSNTQIGEIEAIAGDKSLTIRNTNTTGDEATIRAAVEAAVTAAKSSAAAP